MSAIRRLVAVDVVATRSSAVADAHRHNRQAEEGVVAIRSSAVVAATEVQVPAVVDAHRRNPRAVEGADAMRLAVMADPAARHRWTVRAVRQVAARWPVAAVGARAQAQLAEAVVERVPVVVDAAAVVDDRGHDEQHLSN